MVSSRNGDDSGKMTTGQEGNNGPFGVTASESSNMTANMTAKELTRAINEATDYLIKKDDQGLSGGMESKGQGGLSNRGELDNQANFGNQERFGGLNGTETGDMNGAGTGDMGRMILSGAESEQRVIASNNEVKKIVAEENGYSINEGLSAGQNVIGGESKLEIEERLASDEETAKIESGIGLPKEEEWKHKISVETTKGLVASVQAEVKKITQEGDFNPNRIVVAREMAMRKAMQMNEGYSVGARN